MLCCGIADQRTDGLPSALVRFVVLGTPDAARLSSMAKRLGSMSTDNTPGQNLLASYCPVSSDFDRSHRSSANTLFVSSKLDHC